MFKNLTDFAYKRNRKEALGFYLGYLILIVVVGALAGALFGLASGQENFELGLRIGNIIGILASLGLSFAVLSKKGLMNNFGLNSFFVQQIKLIREIDVVLPKIEV